MRSGVDCSATESDETPSSLDAIDVSDPLSIRKGLDNGKFGSVTNVIEDLLMMKMQIQRLYSETFPSLSAGLFDEGTSQVKQPSKPASNVIIDLEDENSVDENPTSAKCVIILDSDEEDIGDSATEKVSFPSEYSVTDQQVEEICLEDEEVNDQLDDANISTEIHPEVKKNEDANMFKDHLVDEACLKDDNLSAEIYHEVKKNEDGNMVEKPVGGEPFVVDDRFHNEPDLTMKKEEDVSLIKSSAPVEKPVGGESFAVDDRFHYEPDLTMKKDDVSLIKSPTPVCDHEHNRASAEDTSPSAETDNETKRDKGVYVGVEDEEDNETDSEDEMIDAWNEMSMALELSKDFGAGYSPSEVQVKESDETCEHSFVLKDDLGFVCRICGVIDRGIETIIEFQYVKAKRSSRTYSLSQNSCHKMSNGIAGFNLCDDDVRLNEVYAHPRHSKIMKSHQREGFNFLVNNLVGDNPGGCILAHAPGSGKTFMIISFMQSFLAKYPKARPLVVLPKGIVSTWKKEFQIWQIEDFPLYDTAKAEGRIQQLEVLQQWVANKSILFLSYQQFSSIVCDRDNNEASTTCRDILLKVPSVLVLDEGHTPRNDQTDIFQALDQVQTPRKVVLSGTLYQNHVREVFNILNLVRKNFLNTETSRAIVTRIKSKVDMSLSSSRKNFKAGSDAAFFELVENTLQKDKDIKRKMSVIRDLRELTHNVLHYYKGDFLEELPGLVDFTVELNLSSKQIREVKKLSNLRGNFKANYVRSVIYLHPMLQSCIDNKTREHQNNEAPTDELMDKLIENFDVAEGVKAKFFLHVLSLCEAKREKLLVFSQYLVPLKFLERLAVKEKGWSLGKEIFVISGRSYGDKREWSMDRFNNSSAAKVFFGSIKACGEGISLVGASRIIIMDIHLNPSVTRQAIGRAFRPGQTKKVFVYRLVAAESPEVEDYATCSKKDLISKTWFESKENSLYKDIELEAVDFNDCGDDFLEGNPILKKDIKALYRR